MASSVEGFCRLAVGAIPLGIRTHSGLASIRRRRVGEA